MAISLEIVNSINFLNSSLIPVINVIQNNVHSVNYSVINFSIRNFSNLAANFLDLCSLVLITIITFTAYPFLNMNTLATIHTVNKVPHILGTMVIIVNILNIKVLINAIEVITGIHKIMAKVIIINDLVRNSNTIAIVIHDFNIAIKNLNITVTNTLSCFNTVVVIKETVIFMCYTHIVIVVVIRNILFDFIFDFDHK